MSMAQHRLALPAGYELGRYKFQKILGSGGFGITYLAEDKTLGRRVAIKELLPNDIATRIDGNTVVAKTETEEKNLAWARERFLGEGRALAACDHPNVVNVFEMIEANGTAYMVTKYEDGRSFEEWLRELGRAPNESELRSILIPLLSGLETVHNAGFLHRDIKPDNIYVTKSGRPVLLDFGSARQAISNRSMAMTSIVTSGYAPLEQYHEDGNQGPWSDIYALGGVMYRAITGNKPPEATRRLKNDPIEKLTARGADRYDAMFLRAIDRALAVSEKKRPQSVAEWRALLGAEDRVPMDSEETRLFEHPIKKKQRDWAAVIPQLMESRQVRLIAAGAAGLILVAGIVWAIARPKPHNTTDNNTTTSETDSHHHAITVETPGPQQNPPAPQPSTAPVAVITPGPSTAPDLAPAPSPGQQPATLQMDPRLVGTWETRSRWATDPSRTQKARWEQAADGHYTFSGPSNDNGVMNAVDGHMKEYSNSGQTAEISYQFQGDTLITQGPEGWAQLQWHRVSAAAPDTDHGNRGSTTRRQKQQRAPDTGHDILKRVLRRWP